MIITHTSPDWDAIGAVWLLKRYGGIADAPVAFVNTGNPDRALLDAAAAVVDTGREYDPKRRRFDHHQFEGAAANDDCATSLVYADVVNPTRMHFYLDPLVKLIFEGDTGKPGANLSRTVGIHALLSHYKNGPQRPTDEAILEYGMGLLDALATHLHGRAMARQSLDTHTVYQSKDGLVRGLYGAPQGATFAAFDEGARLVVFASEGPETNACGVMRGGEGQEPDCGALVRDILARYPQVAVGGYAGGTQAEMDAVGEAMRAELARWFLHPAGFFAGRGTQKAPDPTPLTASVAIIAGALDFAWHR